MAAQVADVSEVAEWLLLYDLSAARSSRSLTRDKVQAWGAVIDLDTLALVTTELVTNAVRHGNPPVTLRLHWNELRLHIGVSDASPDLPTRPAPQLDATGGRGIALVESLATRWGVARHAGIKTVWADLEPSASPGRL